MVQKKCCLDGCPYYALPCTLHCFKHILRNADQLLFEQCSARTNEGPCTNTVFNIQNVPPLCFEHLYSKETAIQVSLNYELPLISNEFIFNDCIIHFRLKKNNKKKYLLSSPSPVKGQRILRLISYQNAIKRKNNHLNTILNPHLIQRQSNIILLSQLHALTIFPRISVVMFHHFIHLLPILIFISILVKFNFNLLQFKRVKIFYTL